MSYDEPLKPWRRFNTWIIALSKLLYAIDQKWIEPYTFCTFKSIASYIFLNTLVGPFCVALITVKLAESKILYNIYKLTEITATRFLKKKKKNTHTSYLF